MRRTDLFRSVLFAVALGALLLATDARADFEREFTISGDELRVANLVGAITVEPATGSDFEVLVEVKGEDADESLVEFETEDGGRARLIVIFPVDEERDYVYPEFGRGSRTSIRFRENHGDNSSWWRDIFSDMGARRIEISGSGRGLEMWADITIKVPDGKALAVVNGAGQIEAADIGGPLNLDTYTGHIRAENIRGDLLCDTGSGHIEVGKITGEVVIDTGSGHVDVLGMEGRRLLVDTGSGSVSIEDAKADEIEIDTGSGSVQLDTADCMSLHIDTGSGSVRAQDIGADEAEIDTGSGAVRLELVRMGDGPFNIDTGSGGISFEMPEPANASVRADAGSGGVAVRVEDIRVEHMERDEAEFEVGDGKARVRLETGSGRIVISSR